MARGTTAIFALAAFLTAARPAAAQVASPRLVEDDEPAEEPASAPEPSAPPAPSAPAQPRALPRPGEAGAGGAASAGSPAQAPGPTLGPPALPPREPARKVTPVQTSWGRLMDAWGARRRALREGDPALADAAQKSLLSA